MRRVKIALAGARVLMRIEPGTCPAVTPPPTAAMKPPRKPSRRLSATERAKTAGRPSWNGQPKRDWDGPDLPPRVPKPLRPFFSGLDEGKTIRRAALATLLRKFKGPGALEGLWDLLARTYRALADGSAMPVTATQLLEINRIVEALKPKDQRL